MNRSAFKFFLHRVLVWQLCDKIHVDGRYCVGGPQFHCPAGRMWFVHSRSKRKSIQTKTSAFLQVGQGGGQALATAPAWFAMPHCALVHCASVQASRGEILG